LDFVELIMELEVRFGVEIGDEKLGHVRTAGDLHAVLVGELEKQRRDGGVCMNLVAFANLRRAMHSAELKIPRSVNAPIEEVLPREHRRQRWKLLGKQLGLALPKLTSLHPTRDLLVHFLTSAVVGGVLIHLAVQAGLPSIVLGVSFIPMVLLSLMLGYGARSLLPDEGPPDGVPTFRELVRWLADHHPGHWLERGAALREETVWRIYTETLAEWCDTPKAMRPEEIRRDHRLFEDLMLGG
jgi:hypothetical protein